MPETKPSGEGHAAPPVSPAHEVRDIQPRSAVIFFVSLGVLILLALVGMWALFDYLEAREAKLQPPPPPVTIERPLPPEPRLQVTPETDLERLRAREETVLHSYGWVNKEAGVVHIPIDRAMDLILQRGLPARSQPPADSSSSSGTRGADHDR